MKDGKLGDAPVKLEIEDDSLKPASAKQAADRMVQSGVKLFTGVNSSNVLAAVVPGVLESGGFYVSLNPGPSVFASEKCNKNYVVASYQNDAFHEAAGLSANRLGYKKVMLLAPNYQAGRRRQPPRGSGRGSGKAESRLTNRAASLSPRPAKSWTRRGNCGISPR